MKITSIFTNQVNLVLFDNAFTKEAVINKIIKEYDIPIIYLDFDLLYSGYVQSGIINNYENVMVFNPKKENWNDILRQIIIKISNQKCIVIVDSLNGFFTVFDQKDSGKYANSCMMVLSSLIKNHESKIFVNCIARLKDDTWSLRPTGRRVLENKAISKFFVNKADTIQILSAQNKTQGIFEI